MGETPDRRARRAILLIGIAIVAILGFTLLLAVPLGDGGREMVGGHPLFEQEAPEIDSITLEGDQVTLSSLRGRPVLINFWASWCGPCREEFPLLVAAYEEHGDEGLEILGIVRDDSPESAASFAADQGAEWPMVLDTESDAWEAYRATGLPTSFFLDTDGIVRAFSLGAFTEEGLQRQLATILPRD